MPDITYDHLILIMRECPLLDEVEGVLASAHKSLVGRMIKLEQDAGVQAERSRPDKVIVKPAGPPIVDGLAARLEAAFEPVTFARLAVFKEAYDALPAGSLKDQMKMLLEALPASPGLAEQLGLRPLAGPDLLNPFKDGPQ